MQIEKCGDWFIVTHCRIARRNRKINAPVTGVPCLILLDGLSVYLRKLSGQAAMHRKYPRRVLMALHFLLIEPVGRQ